MNYFIQPKSWGDATRVGQTGDLGIKVGDLSPYLLRGSVGLNLAFLPARPDLFYFPQKFWNLLLKGQNFYFYLVSLFGSYQGF